jgi:hypothetical protein
MSKATRLGTIAAAPNKKRDYCDPTLLDVELVEHGTDNQLH